MKINWKLRFKNPLFVAQIIMSVLMPILAYQGLTVEDVTTWGLLVDLLCKAMTNPYLLALVVVSVFNAVVDPTTKGIGDSLIALERTDFKGE